MRKILGALIFLFCLPVADIAAQQQIEYPPGAVPIVRGSTGTTGAVSVTIPGLTNHISYLCGFDVSAIGGTAAVGPITITGLAGGQTLTYQMTSAAAGATFWREFRPCIPANAAATAIVITTTANGTATAVDVNAHGFQE